MVMVKLEVWTGGSNLVKYVYLSTSMPGAGIWELRLAGAGLEAFSGRWQARRWPQNCI